MIGMKEDIALTPYSANKYLTPTCFDKHLNHCFSDYNSSDFLSHDFLTPWRFFTGHSSEKVVSTCYPRDIIWVWNLGSCSFLHWKIRNYKQFEKQRLWQAEDMTIPKHTNQHCLTPMGHFSLQKKIFQLSPLHQSKFKHSTLKIHWINIHQLSWK